MSDDERRESISDESSKPRRESVAEETSKPEPRRESVADESGKPEAKVKMEADLKRRQGKAEDEWKEYEEMRRAEKEKEALEIQQLRERREQRKKERAAEEQRMAELRVVEEQKRRAEDEERQRKKREEESKRREEREIQKKEAEERSKITNRPNFIINKKADVSLSEEPTQEEVAKSKEQLEAERKAILEQRIQPLSVDGLDLQKLKEKAKELHQAIYKLESDKYDLEQQFQRQNLDLMELSERARQMNKGGKGQKVNVSQSDNLSSKLSRAPPKVVMYSQYERVKDPRSFDDRSTVFVGPMYSEMYVKIDPKFKVQMGEQGAEVIGASDSDHGHADAAPVPVDAEA